jgi:hypothetical protein
MAGMDTGSDSDMKDMDAPAKVDVSGGTGGGLRHHTACLTARGLGVTSLDPGPRPPAPAPTHPLT